MMVPWLGPKRRLGVAEANQSAPTTMTNIPINLCVGESYRILPPPPKERVEGVFYPVRFGRLVEIYSNGECTLQWYNQGGFYKSHITRLTHY